jgi:type II secretory pathway component GspD/PulD (secretin)
MVATMAGFAWLLFAQDGTPPGFQAYRLKHAPAREIVPQLDSMLSGEGTRYEIVVDQNGNRILVQGGDATQRIAGQLIEALDQPVARPTAAQATPTIVRNYPVAPSLLDKTLADLRKQFPPQTGARIAADSRTSQLLVVAPQDVQNRIAQTLRPAGTTQAVAVAAPAARSTDSVTLQNISGRELEDALTRLWGQRLTRDATNDGDVAALSLASVAGSQPVLQIDRRHDSVAFLGSPESVQVWQRVVGALDRLPGVVEQQTDLVPLSRADPKKVQRAVTMLQTGGAAAASPAARLASMPTQEAGAAPPSTPAAAPTSGGEPAAGPEPPGGENGSELPVDEGGLIGPVQIEFLEGLDVIVIRGHKRDVERVRKIIAEIETYSTETQPSIEILQLEHVGSQVLADLVTTVYNEILSPRQGQVTIRALVKPNALLMIGRPESVETVKSLIAKLDQPTKPEAQFEVFPLKHVSAVDAQATIQSFFVDRLGQTQQQTTQAAQGAARPALGTRVNVVSDYRSNSLIVQASPSDMEEVRRMVAQLDIENPAAANELRIFRLKNALATDVGPVLQDALNWQLIGSRTPLGATRTGTFGGGQTFGQTEERARLRSAILSFMTVDAKDGKAIESGQLADVRITVDTNSNALVVTAPPKSMGLIEALIKELDTLPNAQAQIKVFTIVNGDARSLASMLTQLLGQQSTTQSTTGTLFGQGTVSPFLAAGMQSGAASGESALVPVRFGVDQRTNSIIATGSEGDLGVVEAVLFRLDEQSLKEHRTMVYWLANVPAEEVATALNDWIQNRTTLFQQQLQISPESPDIQWNRRVIVVPETISNTIIISAAPELFDEVKHVVESIDRKPPLIKIDVMIAEILLSHDFEFGTEFGLQDALLYDRNDSPGFNFNNFSLGDTTDGNPANLLGQGLSTFGLGRVSPNLGYGGLVLSASSDAISALIRALQEEGRAQILSRPTVTALDKQPAFINVGATVSRLAGTTLNNNNSQQNIEDVETGLTVAVTPQITPDGLIVMEVDAIKSELSTTEGVELPTGGVDGGTFTQYNINKAQAQTTISARSGQTIVFAGLIQASKANIVRGIPFLSDVPVLGPLFQFTKEEETRKELLIILTPHVIRSDDDLDRIRMAESERMSWCLADVMSLYGDVGLSARPGSWCDCDTEVPLIFPDANPTGIESGPAPMPAAGGEPNSVLPAPGHTGNGQMRILEPTVPADGAVAPAEPISNMSYQAPLPGGPYPGAALGFGGANQQMPQAQPAGPYSPGPLPPATSDPYTAARRLPQGP